MTSSESHSHYSKPLNSSELNTKVAKWRCMIAEAFESASVEE